MKIVLPIVLALFATCVAASAAEKGQRLFSARLSGFNEVHFNAGPPATLRGAVSTKASGSFTATLNNAGDLIDYELSYSGLEGSVTQAHIHFGQPSTVGGIIVWLCQTDTNQAPEPLNNPNITPTCPGPNEGTVKGTITAEEVLTVNGQGVSAGEFDELVRALRAETAYANVHSSAFGPGEVRGQIRVGGQGKGQGK
ncbi:MAG TPA: CHRD domain-containing protein [Candidatus Binatia bacterium]|nr:CHRD domain-containing protein [Candidatus Binatia bacterium]